MTEVVPVGAGGPIQRKSWRAAVTPLIYLSPSLALFGVFIAFPFLRSIYLSFTDTRLLTGKGDPVGFDNFIEIFADPFFPSALGNTAVWTFGGVALQLVFGVLGALLLNNRFKLRGVVRGLAMVPWATPSVLVALIWLWMLDPNRGIINGILLSVGLIDEPVAFLADSQTAMATLIVVDAWQGVPFFAVMVLAALQGVPEDLKESARMDGAGHWGVFRNVVLPSILPTILITVVLRLIWTSNYIDLAYVLTSGGPARATTTVPLLSYLTAYKGGEIGLGSAYAMVHAVLLTVLVVLYIRATRERNS